MPPSNSKFDRELRKLLRENPGKWTDASISFAIVTRPPADVLKSFLDATDTMIRALAGVEAGVPPPPKSGPRLRRR